MARTAITEPSPTVVLRTDKEAESIESEDDTVEPTMGREEETANFIDLAVKLSFAEESAVCIPREAVISIQTNPIKVKKHFLTKEEIAFALNPGEKQSHTEKPRTHRHKGRSNFMHSLSVRAINMPMDNAEVAAVLTFPPDISIPAFTGTRADAKEDMSDRYVFTTDIDGYRTVYKETEDARETHILTFFDGLESFANMQARQDIMHIVIIFLKTDEFSLDVEVKEFNNIPRI